MHRKMVSASLVFSCEMSMQFSQATATSSISRHCQLSPGKRSPGVNKGEDQGHHRCLPCCLMLGFGFRDSCSGPRGSSPSPEVQEAHA